MADTGNNTLRLGAWSSAARPVIVAQPQSQTVNPGSDATFSVGALGAAPLSYQWRLQHGGHCRRDRRSYTRTNAQTIDGGNYSVVVINNQLGNVTSADAVLCGQRPPSITSQPQSQAVNRGAERDVQRGRLRHRAAQLPVAVQRERHCRERRPVLHRVFGPAHAMQGSYSVVVTNAIGAALSANAMLAVIPLDAWGDNTWDQLDFPGQAFNVIAIAAGAWHSLALRNDGVVVAWGDDSAGQCDVPATLQAALAIAGGGYHSLADPGRRHRGGLGRGRLWPNQRSGGPGQRDWHQRRHLAQPGLAPRWDRGGLGRQQLGPDQRAGWT